jgi:CcmD family protein
MMSFEPASALSALIAAIQEGAPRAAMTAAEAAARPEAVRRGLRFLAGAYSVVWGVLAVYLVMLSMRQRRLAQQIRRLRERLGV